MEKNLSSYPHLVKEWHSIKNGKLKPENFTYGSGKKVWWKCPKGDDHQWMAIIDNRARSNGCPFCSGRKASKTNNLFIINPKITKEWHPTKNGNLKPEDFTFKSNSKVWWKCSKGDAHEWEATINSRSVGRGCPYCSNKKVSKTNNFLFNYPKIAREWHTTKNGNLKPENFTYGSGKKVWWKCPKGDDHEWNTTIHNRTTNKRNCPFCYNQKVSRTNNFLVNYPKVSKEWHPTKNGALRPEDCVLKSSKRVWWKCPKGDDHEWITSISLRVGQKTGCPFCIGQKVSKTNNFLYKYPKIAKEWHPTKNGNHKPENFTDGSSKVFWWKCYKEEDHEWKSSINDRRTSGCPNCADYRYNPNIPGMLYYIAITPENGQTLYKIGITNHSVEKRFPVKDRARIRILKLWRFQLGKEAAKLEKEILTEFNQFKYKGSNLVIRRGNTELFTKDILNLDNGTEINLHDDLPIFRRRQKDFNFIKTK